MARPDYYLKIDGIDGESTKKGVENWIELLDWSWSETNSGSMAQGGGGGTGRVSMSDFNFSMTMCKASPKLQLACACGDHIAWAELICREAGKDQQPYLKYKFSELIISSYSTGGGAGDDNKPTCRVSFNYTKVEWAFAAQKKDGTLENHVKAGYDLKKLAKV
jgi:type VI secretion system secreted protein Hcp